MTPEDVVVALRAEAERQGYPNAAVRLELQVDAAGAKLYLAAVHCGPWAGAMSRWSERPHSQSFESAANRLANDLGWEWRP